MHVFPPLGRVSPVGQSMLCLYRMAINGLI